MTRDEQFMQAALKLAEQALELGEVPVGAVVVQGDRIVGQGFNTRESEKNSLCHAEIRAIYQACKALGGWRLQNCELFVTLEPCPMCAGAVINSRIKRVIYGAADKKAGSYGSVTNLFSLPYNHRPETVGNVLGKECADILSEFFSRLRIGSPEDISAPGIIISPDGVLWDKKSHIIYPEAAEVLQTLSAEHRLFAMCSSNYDIESQLRSHSLDRYFEGIVRLDSNGLTGAENLRIYTKRMKIKKAVCIGCTENERQAAQTCGFAFIHAAYSGEKVRTCNVKIGSLSEAAQSLRCVTAPDNFALKVYSDKN